MKKKRVTSLASFILLLVISFLPNLRNPIPAAAANSLDLSATTSNIVIYDESLQTGWQEWSSANVDLKETSPTYKGIYVLSFLQQSASAKFYLHRKTPLALSPYGAIRFAAKATQSGQKYGIVFIDQNDKQIGNPQSISQFGGELQTSVWTVYQIPLSSLGAANAQINGFKLIGLTGSAQPIVYMDDIELISKSIVVSPTVSPTKAPTPTPVVSTTPSPQPTVVTPTPTQPAQTGIWRPTPDKPIHWHWQLSQDFAYPRDVVAGATVYDIDGEQATADTVAKLHAMGPNIKVICYMDAGVYEDYRSDASSFPQSIIGNADTGWDGSYWLDIRQTSTILPILKNRMQHWCKDKGFDAVEPDETEVWSNNSGFPITKEQNNYFNQQVAALAHSLGLSVGLKGNTTEAPELWQYFDWTLNEQCWQYKECDNIKTSFIDHGKAALNIEYNVNPDCTQANSWHMNSARRDLNLVGPTSSGYKYQPCVPNTKDTWQ